MIYRIYNSGAANTTTTQSVDVRDDDVIESVSLQTAGVTFTDGDTCYVELSWLSTPSKGINDTNGVIWQNWFTNELTTSGAAQSSSTVQNWFASPIKIEAGERLYLHVVSTGTGTFPTYATITTSKGGTKRAQARR